MGVVRREKRVGSMYEMIIMAGLLDGYMHSQNSEYVVRPAYVAYRTVYLSISISRNIHYFLSGTEYATQKPCISTH